MVLCAGDSACLHLLHGAVERESFTSLGKYHRILNTKGVWEEQRASRDILSVVGPAGFSKYFICQMKAVENYRLNPTENRNENSIVSALGSLC